MSNGDDDDRGTSGLELALFKLLAAMVAVTVLLVLAVWCYRYIQYRRAVQLSQMRWLHYEPDKLYQEAERGLDWPAMRAMLLSPIPEERGRESIDSQGSLRPELRAHTSSFVSYGSLEHGP